MELFRLFGSIFVDDKDAIAALDNTQKKADETHKGLGNIAGTAAKVGTAVVAGAGAAAAGLTALVTKTVETTSAIKDNADKAGMGAEEYQKWKFAAEQSGMSMETLQGAMIKQQKAFSEAKTGSKSMSEAYSKLGMDIGNIGSSSEAFDVVMKKLAGMTDESERNALANDIFGKSYAELTPLLSEGADGMDALKQKASDLGMVMSDEAVSSGEALGDTLDQLKGAFGGIINNLGSSLIPIVQTIADLIIQNMPMIQGMFASIGPALSSFLAQALPVLVQLAQQLLPVILQVIQSLLPIIVQLLPLFTTIIMSLLPPLIDLLNLILPPLIQLLKTIIPPLTAVIRVLADVFGTVLGNAIKDLEPVISGVTKILGGIIDFITGVFTGNWQKAWDGVKNIFGGIFESLGALIKAPINAVIDLINRAFGAIGEFKVPDWIPIWGGKTFSLPKIPRLAVGLDYVPYDNFPAILHKGERVMTAQEARQGSGMTINIQNFVNNRAQDVQQFAEELEFYRARKAAANGMA